MAHGVDAPAPGPTGQLLVLPRGEGRGVRAAELGEPLDHHRPGRHVDAEGQGLGGEHHLQQALGEALLDRLAERRHQPGVVGGDARLEGRRPRAVPERAQVVVAQPLHRGLDELPDPGPLFGCGQPDPVLEAVAGGVVAGRPGEDEGDGRQHPRRSQVLDHLGASRVPGSRWRGLRRRRSSRETPSGLGLPSRSSGKHRQPVATPFGHGEVVVELHRAVGLDDDPGRPPDRGQPGAEVGGVADRGRQAHEAHPGGVVTSTSSHTEPR